ncbi:MAG TPA: hypothetical protein VGI39_39950 [Polyangiaceae bacterium]
MTDVAPAGGVGMFAFAGGGASADGMGALLMIGGGACAVCVAVEVVVFVVCAFVVMFCSSVVDTWAAEAAVS